MKVYDLIQNQEFNFNAPFRVVVYAPTQEDIDHVEVLYRSDEPRYCPPEVGNRFISAVNNAEDGIIDIECY